MGTWIPTRKEAVKRLDAFVPRAGRAYTRFRNYDLGPDKHDHVSTLSPWIRHRAILDEEVIAAVLDRHNFSAAEKFIQEVSWRTYWKGWLELRPAVWNDYGESLNTLIDRVDRDADLRNRWEEATAGRTGIGCFDGWSRELVQTGYLHNHARMWFASIWIFTLELPWELGADFFLRHLLDGDPASNTLSWRWVAGLQTRGKTYLARPQNIAKYTENRFGSIHGLSTSARPLDGRETPPAGAPPKSARWDGAQPTGLLITEEDLHPDFLLGQHTRFRGIAALTGTGHRSPFGVAAPAQDFVAGGIGDSLDRFQKRLESVGDAVRAVGENDSIVRWARERQLRQVVTAYVPVSPTAALTRALTERLATFGITLVPVLRRWDDAAWRPATRGFFPFRQKIPRILSEIRGTIGLAT